MRIVSSRPVTIGLSTYAKLCRFQRNQHRRVPPPCPVPRNEYACAKEFGECAKRGFAVPVVSIDYGVWATVGEAARILGVKPIVVTRSIRVGRFMCSYQNRQCFVRRADFPGFTPPPKARPGRPRKVSPDEGGGAAPDATTTPKLER